MTLQNALDEFLDYHKMVRHTSKTIQDYREFIGYFIRFVGSDFSIEQIDWEIIKGYILFQSGRVIETDSYRTYLVHLKAFLNWMNEEYGLNIDTNRIKLPKASKKEITPLSRDMVAQMFEAAQISSGWLSARNFTFLALMLDSGLRRNELLCIRRSDVHFNHFRIYISQGKGRKSRYVPFGAYTYSFLVKYLELCPFDNDMLFVTRSGKPITENTIKQFMSKLKKKLPFDIHCHLLRHNFATNAFIDNYSEHGQPDAYSLMTIMGHEDIKTTERYLHHAHSKMAVDNHISHLDKLFLGANLRAPNKPNELGELDRSELMSLTL